MSTGAIFNLTAGPERIWGLGNATILFTQKKVKDPKGEEMYHNSTGSLEKTTDLEPWLPGLQFSLESSRAQPNCRGYEKEHSWCFLLIVHCPISPKSCNLKAWINSRLPVQ